MDPRGLGLAVVRRLQASGLRLDRAIVREVGFATAAPGDRSLKLVIRRGADGRCELIDGSDLDALRPALRRCCVTLATAVLDGADLRGTSVTTLRLLDRPRWVGVSAVRATQCRRRRRGPHPDQA